MIIKVVVKVSINRIISSRIVRVIRNFVKLFKVCDFI